MNLSVSVKLDSLLRDLRLKGHALAEAAERAVLRGTGRGSLARLRKAEPPGGRERDGERA